LVLLYFVFVCFVLLGGDCHFGFDWTLLARQALYPLSTPPVLFLLVTFKIVLLALCPGQPRL
jgi:hypothetical protein